MGPMELFVTINSKYVTMGYIPTADSGGERVSQLNCTAKLLSAHVMGRPISPRHAPCWASEGKQSTNMHAESSYPHLIILYNSFTDYTDMFTLYKVT